jgi:hypothetical protein
MARKKSNDNAGALGILLFAALATLITFASAVYGAVVLVAWSYYNRKSSSIPDALSDGFFIATRAESRRIAVLDKALADERRILASLESQGRGLSRRGDGEFDERSGLGKRLNHELSASRASERCLVIDMAELRNHSYQRRSHYLGIKVGAASWGKAGIAYITAILFFAIYTPEWVAGLNQFLNNSGWLGQIKFIPMLWGILAAAALISLAVQQAARLYFKHSIEQTLAQAEKPDKHAAVMFTELLAAQSDIGLHESDDLDRAEAIFKEKEGIRQAAKVVDAVEVVSLTSTAPKVSPAPPEVETSVQAITASVDAQTVQMPLRIKRTLWMRLVTSVGFGALGLVSGVVAFGLLGQGDFGTALVLIFPLIGLVWGFRFRKFSKKTSS